MKVSNWIHFNTASVFLILSSLTPSANHQPSDLELTSLLLIQLLELSSISKDSTELPVNQMISVYLMFVTLVSALLLKLLELANLLLIQMVEFRSTSNQEVDSTLLVILLMELSALQTENAEAVSAIISNASHHQLLDQVERTLFAALTETVSHTNSVIEMDSAQTLEWDFSFQEKLETPVMKILSACLEFVMQVPASNQISLGLPVLSSLDQVERTLFAALTETASHTNSVI